LEDALTVKDRLEIAELLNSYSWASDEREYGQLADCFSEDAVFQIALAGGPEVQEIRGRSSIVDWIRERRRGQGGQQRRHTGSGLVVEAYLGGEATVRSYVTVMLAESGRLSVATTGWYRDLVRKVDGRWVIARRFVHLDVVI
jgi:hypothetical protein